MREASVDFYFAFHALIILYCFVYSIKRWLEDLLIKWLASGDPCWCEIRALFRLVWRFKRPGAREEHTGREWDRLLRVISLFMVLKGSDWSQWTLLVHWTRARPFMIEFPNFEAPMASLVMIDATDFPAGASFDITRTKLHDLEFSMTYFVLSW